MYRLLQMGFTTDFMKMPCEDIGLMLQLFPIAKELEAEEMRRR